MKRKKTLNKIIAMMLCLTMALTGITLGDTATANAATPGIENFADLMNTTVTMKVGDVKRISLTEYVSETSSMTINKTRNYDWKSSDESVVSLVNEYELSVTGVDVNVVSFTITAEKEGTAIISGTNAPTGKVISMTVNVEKPKMTAKQQKCKHKWKTTKKATCLRSGMKTCKKCKLQKTIKKKNHKFVTQAESKVTRPQYLVYVCNGCTSDDPETRRKHDSTTGSELCTEYCGMEFSQKDYGSVEAAYKAYAEHQEKCKHGHSTSQTIEYGDPVSETVMVTRCKYCGNTPEAIEKYYSD